MSTLIIAEKNQAAKAIAEALGQTKLIKNLKVNVYYVPSKDIFVIPLRGHLLGYKNVDAFKSWTKTNPRDIIIDAGAIKKVPLNYAYPYIKALKEYAKICDQCIIATDADIEGVNIGLFDALPFVKKANSVILVSQMWLSSLQKNEILNKYNNRITPKWSWGQSAEARAIIDAIIGFSATREVTNTFKPLLTKINQKFVSIGRVQTSLLYLIYLREKRIKDFIPEPYITINANLNYNNYKFKATHQLNPFRKEKEENAKKIYQKIKNEKIALILNNSQNKVERRPPTPLNTSKALVLLTKTLKISAIIAFNTMNTLYLNKIISYPRTDSDVYKSNFDHKQYLKKFTMHSQYGNYGTRLINVNKVIPTKGKKDAGDHPPITPLESLELNSTRFENDLQRKVYNILARHYLALFGGNASELKTVLKLSIEEEPFISRLISLVSDGFLEIAPFLKPRYDTEIQITGDQIPIERIDLNNQETKPPPKYTDTTLLQLMERNNLGTKATRPTIIQVLQDRNLIYQNNRQYGITELGIFIIENLIDIWLPFLEPSFTREIEEQLEDIREGKKKMDAVVQNMKLKFLDLFDKFLNNKQKFISNMNSIDIKDKNLTQLKQKKDFPQTKSVCPHCKTHPMKLITTYKKKRFLACSNEECMKKYLSLPHKGRISILKSSICSICSFNVFKITKRTNNKSFSYYICPKCWNEGLGDKSGKGFCSNCQTHTIKDNKCLIK